MPLIVISDENNSLNTGKLQRRQGESRSSGSNRRFPTLTCILHNSERALRSPFRTSVRTPSRYTATSTRTHHRLADASHPDAMETCSTGLALQDIPHGKEQPAKHPIDCLLATRRAQRAIEHRPLLHTSTPQTSVSFEPPARDQPRSPALGCVLWRISGG